MSKLTEILLDFASSEIDEMGVRMGAISENRQLFTLEEAEAAILAWVNEVIGEDFIVETEYDREHRAVNREKADQRKRAGL